MSTDIFEAGLGKSAANYTALTPLSFIERAASVYPRRLAVIHGEIRRTWQDTYARARRLASALAARGIGAGDTVAVMLPNTPAMVEAHFGIPMLGAVLNTLNTRLDAATLAFMLNHGEAKALLVDREFSEVMRAVLPAVERPIFVVDVDDPLYTGPGERIGEIEYEALLASGDPNYAWQPPQDEWDAISLNYTSGTTGNPKGVVYHHRGAYTAAISNILEWDMPKHAVYLWTLPMFHCNGWTFPWAIAARAGVNVCLRKVDAKAIFDLIRSERVTHYCGAPIVHNLLVNAPDELKAGIEHRVHAMVAGAAPPAALIESLERLGFELTHVYGLTEVYGPASVCPQQQEWSSLDIGERARLNARQGVRYHLQDGCAVLDPDTMTPVPADGETIGEIMFRGNITMKGYLKNATATEEAFRGGWFHTGDLGVAYPDGYVRIKDRSKDIIISGGENISSIEIEDVLYRHPAVMAAAVVAKPDPRWGETPCAFVELKNGATATAADLIAHCKLHLAGFKVPRAIEFLELPKTSTGKIQKFELRKLAKSVAAIDV
ncbi:acyl-CoA synthetase [Trinickia soli]|uniref:Acyl-CoA synthetase n=1 Tax=Trinickia soli TaxID=380675 RepID=A0A2N7WFU0_9BURK|nr:acyl-CoA synthetase [Trinickia soli]PMS28252.1 acyl-CoA synthetase [Trinickia soli]CAB3662510.1 Long-chain-fatty-acid--CoA ligase [Trinickia soli]